MAYHNIYIKKDEGKDFFETLNPDLTAEEKSNMRFDELYVQYDSWRSFYVRYGTRVLTNTIVKNYLKPDPDATVKEALGFRSVSKAYITIVRKNTNPMWKNRAFGCIRKMITTAFKWKLLTLDEMNDSVSILDNLNENRQKRPQRQILDDNEVKKFFAVVDDPDDRVLFLLAMTLGARIGEICGLTWDVYDDVGGYIEIKQQVTNNGHGGEELVDDLKTSHSYRTCKVPPQMMKILADYKERTGGKGFIFKSIARPGAPMSKSAIRGRLKKYCDKAGIPEITMHSWRHMKATNFMRVCNDMQEVKAAASYLGHSATMLIETYGHASGKATEEILGRLHDVNDILGDEKKEG